MLQAPAKSYRNPSRGREEVAILSRLNDEISTARRAGYEPKTWDSAAQQGASLTVQDAIGLALAATALATAERESV